MAPLQRSTTQLALPAPPTSYAFKLLNESNPNTWNICAVQEQDGQPPSFAEAQQQAEFFIGTPDDHKTTTLTLLNFRPGSGAGSVKICHEAAWQALGWPEVKKGALDGNLKEVKAKHEPIMNCQRKVLSEDRISGMERMSKRAHQ